jgi:hypothetical protein
MRSASRTVDSAVGNHQHRALLAQQSDSVFHSAFRRVIQRRSGLVEKQNGGVFDKRAGNCNPLALTAARAGCR